MKEQEVYLLITRYLSRQASAEEQAQLMEWLAADQQHQETFEEVKHVWLGYQRSTDAASQPALSKLQARIAADTPVPAKRSRVLVYSLSAAAAVLVIMMATWRLFPGRHPGAQVAYMKESTQPGQQKTVVLEDGTRIVLGPQSTLSYPVSFHKGGRSVTVEGLAYFEVSKSPHQPFTVQTPALTVQVLGTHFSVNTGHGQPCSSVALLEGSVKVKVNEKADDGYLLTPGQELSFNHDTHEVAQYSLDSATALGWQHRELKFRNETFGSIAPKIESMYGVKIIFSDPAAADTRLYATFNNEPLPTVMETICTSGVLAYHQDGDTIYVQLKTGQKASK